MSVSMPRKHQVHIGMVQNRHQSLAQVEIAVPAVGHRRDVQRDDAQLVVVFLPDLLLKPLRLLDAIGVELRHSTVFVIAVRLVLPAVEDEEIDFADIE